MSPRWEGENQRLTNLQHLNQLKARWSCEAALYLCRVWGRHPGNLYYKIAGWLWGASRCYWGHPPLPAPELFSQSHSSPLVVCPVLHAQCFAGQRTALLFPPDRNCLQTSLLWPLADWEEFLPFLCSHMPLEQLGAMYHSPSCLQPSGISNYHSLFCHSLVKLYILAFLR